MATRISAPDPLEADGKEAFATLIPKPPGRLRRFLAHEWTAAAGAGVLLAVAMTWPAAPDAATTIPQDIHDPLQQAWQVAWGGHALSTAPASVWDANPFFPERSSLAFSDSLLGYAPLGMIGDGATAAVARYNLIYILLHALAFFGAYALTRQLGAHAPGALVAGLAFAYAPWRLAHGGHMNILSTGGIALALAMLARGHGFTLREGYQSGRARPIWVLAGWAVAAWQMTLSFAIGIPFGYALAVIVLIMAVAWLRGHRPDQPRQVLISDLSGGALFAVTTCLMAMPYLQLAKTYPYARRSVADLAVFSPPLRGMLTAPAESWLWGQSHQEVRATLAFPPEMALLPGFFLIGLAVIGLGLSAWRVRTRLWLAGTTVLAGYLALGTQAWGQGEYGYVFLFQHLPGLDAIRTPGRLVVWVTLLLAVLAAGAVSAICDRAHAITENQRPSHPRILTRLAVLAPVLLVTVECMNLTPHPRVPGTPAALRNVQGPVLVLPSDPAIDQAAMLWSTYNFPRIVNGISSFSPISQHEIRAASVNFPSTESIAYLRRTGVRTVVVLRDRIPGTPWQHVSFTPGADSGVRRRDVGTATIFTL
ncbi:hypothetical protein [Streptomyces sp. NRRL F-2664]|uniref:hypothetical protein n=1 Tax=Streptomyces sp. NRRL F-2664 TaxID=1463842 RepID=UPI00068ED6CA|nr:hypothetical protein [Streptomyces sp. NRRL F-2664]